MKRKIAAVLITLCMVTLSACGGSSVISTGNKKLENAVYDDDSVSLAAYTGLKAEKKVYKVTDEALDSAVNERLSDYAEYKSVSRPSRNGDWVYVDYKALVYGESISEEEDYSFILGDEEYGEEFDEKLTGVLSGDKLNFTIEYDDDFEDEDFAGNAVDFEVSIKEVKEEIMPDATDEFVKEKFGYSTYDEFVSSVRTSISEEYERESNSELQEDLLQQVIKASSILQYSKEEYEEAEESIDSIYKSYADSLGMDLASAYELFEVTEADVEEEVQNELYRTIVVNAIIKNEDLTLSEEEYEDGIVYYMEENEYDSKDEFLNDYGEEEVRSQLMEDKVLNMLTDAADITEVEAEHEDE